MTSPSEGVPPWGSSEPEPQRPAPGSPEEPSRELSCPVCRGSSFSEEEGRMQTRWGMGSHVFTIRICDRCGHSLLFHQGSGMAM